MRKIKLFAICMILLILWVNNDNLHGQNKNLAQEYQIERIKRNNNWFFIYASRNDSLFKIVSKKPIDKGNHDRHAKIRRHRKYLLILDSYSANAPIIAGIKAWIPGYTGGFYLDSCTNVVLEPHNGIFDLYSSPNLDGIYYLPPHETDF